jgi:flagellar basal-body rod protein FlgF
MDSGYYAACAGLRAQTQALEVIANNLANINTGGYRGQQPTFHSLLANATGAGSNPLNRAINNFNVLGGTRMDLSQGNLERTGNPLDVAIEGAGFFAVQTPAGTLYTRKGNFQVSASGQLTTSGGDQVLGTEGPITLPSGTITISPDGTLSVNGAVAATLRVVEFTPGTSPTPVGPASYSVPSRALQPATGSNVRQGMLESSNVNSVTAAVDLILVQRHAEMLQRALSAFYSDFNRMATDELPRVS